MCQGLKLDGRVPLEQINVQVVENDPIGDFLDEVLPHPEEEVILGWNRFDGDRLLLWRDFCDRRCVFVAFP